MIGVTVGVNVGVKVLVGDRVSVKVGGTGVSVAGIGVGGLVGINVAVDVFVMGIAVKVGETVAVEQAEIIMTKIMSDEKHNMWRLVDLIELRFSFRER
jgi:hypothetical protein